MEHILGQNRPLGLQGLLCLQQRCALIGPRHTGSDVIALLALLQVKRLETFHFHLVSVETCRPSRCPTKDIHGDGSEVKGHRDFLFRRNKAANWSPVSGPEPGTEPGTEPGIRTRTLGPVDQFCWTSAFLPFCCHSNS